MVETRRALERLGIDVEVDLSPDPDVRAFDFVHVFNIQNPADGLTRIRTARRAGKPVALSTIYWDVRPLHSMPETAQYHRSALVRAAARISPKLALGVLNARRASRVSRAAREMAELSDVLLPNSVAELEILIAQLDYPEARAKACVVVNGVSMASPQPAPHVERLLRELPAEYVLEVGRIEPCKGQIRLVRALESAPELPIVIIGAGSDSSYGRDLDQAARQRGNTFIVGPVPHAQLPTFYERARVHALPSMRESPGLVTMEAAHHGANCVVGIHAPVQEYFGSLAWVCDPTAEDSIRAAVTGAWRAPRDGALGRRVRDTFSWDVAAGQTRDAYLRVAAARSKAA